MIAVLIPTLDEEVHIGGLLQSLLDVPCADILEIWVIDGGSRDRTRQIVQSMASIDARINLLDNPQRRQSAAVNIAADRADPQVDVLVRLDAHAEYPAGFVQAVTATLREKQADSVVVRLLSRGETNFQRAVAAMSNSRLGTGGSLHRVGGSSRWIDHGHHAAFRRESFSRLGGYDSRFVANEDAEFDARLRRSGGRIWLDGNLDVVYWPRSTPSALSRQYFVYGRGRAQNSCKHKEVKVRQLIAPMLVLSSGLAILIAPVFVWSLLIPLAYIGLLLSVSISTMLRSRKMSDIATGGALAIMHLSWGIGFLLGLFDERTS